MSKDEIIKWLQNLKTDIGQTQHQDLWHYAEILDEIISTIEISEEQLNKLNICEYYYKGYCSKYDDGCFHQCDKNQASEDTINREKIPHEKKMWIR